MTECSSCPRLRGRRSHCLVCHSTFGGSAGFDAHRRGPATNRRCAGDVELVALGLSLRDGTWRRPLLGRKVA